MCLGVAEEVMGVPANKAAQQTSAGAHSENQVGEVEEVEEVEEAEEAEEAVEAEEVVVDMGLRLSSVIFPARKWTGI